MISDSGRSETRILVILPAFNEEESIGAVLDEITDALPSATCLVVDDCSRDATASIAVAAGAHVLRLPVNLGVGGAMRAGYLFAERHGFNCAVQVDADGQHDPRAVPMMIDSLANADIVIGARFAGVGDYRVTGPRWWAMSFLSAVLSKTIGRHLTDTTSGFKACGPRAISLFARDMPAEYLGDTVEALVIAHKAGLTVDQVPVAMRARAGGQPSHDPLKSAVYLVRGVFALTVAFIRPAGKGRS